MTKEQHLEGLQTAYTAVDSEAVWKSMIVPRLKALWSLDKADHVWVLMYWFLHLGDDADYYTRAYYAVYGPELHCRNCGKLGVTHFPNGPLDSLNIEHGGWCSYECHLTDMAKEDSEVGC
jgi:hypothetical protein